MKIQVPCSKSNEEMSRQGWQSRKPRARPFFVTAYGSRAREAGPVCGDPWRGSDLLLFEGLRPRHPGFHQHVESHPLSPGLQLGSQLLGPATLGGRRRQHERPTVLHLVLPRFYLMPRIQHIVDFFPQRAALFFFFFLFQGRRWKAMWLLLLAGMSEAFLHHHMKWSRNLHLRKAKAPGLLRAIGL